MELIYSSINRSHKTEGFLEFKIRANKQDYALLKHFEDKETTIFYEAREDEIIDNSGNISIIKSDAGLCVKPSFIFSAAIFNRIENEDIWESPLFNITFRSRNYDPEMLKDLFKKQITGVMINLKSRLNSGDQPVWEKTDSIEY